MQKSLAISATPNTISIKKPDWKLYIGLPALIYFLCFLITLSSPFKNHNQIISAAIIGDLLISAPLIYLFLIRKSSISKLTTLRIFLIGIVVAGTILNANSNYFIHLLKVWVSPVIESVLIFIIARKFYLANKEAGIKGKSKIDFLDHCRKVLTQVLGNQKIGDIISSEIAVFYYAFIAKKEKDIDYKCTFTSYKENGVILVLSVFLFLFITETIGVHFLLTLWSKVYAWIFTGLSLYTCLQLYAHIKSIRARVVCINAEDIELHMGLAADAYIDINNIEKVEMATRQCNEPGAIKIALLKGLENHNMIIRLKQPVTITKIFGIKKQAKIILFFVDKPKEFLESIQLRIKASF